MDASARLLALLAPLQIGDEVAEGFRLEDASAELGMRYRLGREDARVWIDVMPTSGGRSWAARSARLGFAYRTEGGRNPIDPKVGERLCLEIAARVAPNEAGLGALDEARDRALAPRVRDVDVERLLELAGPPSQSFYTLSPYVGCVIGCKFCYAQSRLADLHALVGRKPMRWGSWVEVRRNAAKVLGKELANLPPRPIKFCPVVSDPYQAVEGKARITRACLEVIAAASRSWPTMLLTRSERILEDFDQIVALPERRVGVSLPTIDDEVRAHFEPRASSVSVRLEVLRRFRAAGVGTLAVVQPLLPGSVEAHADALAELADSVSIDLLRGVEGAEAEFSDPRYAQARDGRWQQTQATKLRDALEKRGVAVWQGELPPDLAATR